jgi:FKBP-type peptidyl-prolyl cis-trans isomerase
MKINLTTVAILLTVGVTLSTGACAQQTSLELKTQKDKASYAIGASIAKSLQRDGVEVDTAILLRGLNDGLAGGKLQLTDEEAKAAITTLQQESKAKHEAQQKSLGETNQKESETFLANNKTQKGVVTLPSGLQYKVEKQGDGPKPLATDTVVCNYQGTLINGKEFDSSYKRGQPATFPVTGVIPGWTEILQLMPVGSKYQVFIPSELAYGGRGAGADIGPNATLIFEIELLSIKEKPAAAPAPHTAKPAGPAK